MTQEQTSDVRMHASGAVDFVDGDGLRWTVTEIPKLGFSERLVSLFPHPERREGWLLFESESGVRRRLAPVPEAWRALGIDALQGCLARASTASSKEQRRRTDRNS